MSAEGSDPRRLPAGPASWVLRALLPRSHRRLVLDDLAEEWARRVAAEGLRSARVWYRGEIWRSMGPALRLRSAPWANHDGARARGGRASGRVPFARTAAELRHATRRLMRSPGFAGAVVLTLAVGVGANVAIFSLVDGVLLRPLPYPESDRLVAIRHSAPGLFLAETDLSDGTYVHYRSHNAVFEELAYWQEASVNITSATAPERVPLVLVTRSFFPVVGVAPLLGPGFDPDLSDGSQMVILSHRLWKRRYGEDPGLIGRTVEVNHKDWRVMGVMPPGFAFPNPEVDIWLDIGDPADSPQELRFGGFYYPAVARLRPGVTAQRAAADLRRLVGGLEGLYPDATRETLDRAGLTPIVVPLKDHIIRDVGSMLWLLLGAVAFVLLIACANVTNLYLVRSVAREREVVVRAALGAGRADLIRHFLAESVLLASAGGALGLLVGWISVRTLVATSTLELPRLEELTVGGRAVAFAIGLSILAGIVLGLVPALRVVRLGIGRGLRSAGRAFTTSRERQRVQRALVAVQVALALTLLVGSVLMLQTFWNLRRADPGFDARDLLTFDIVLPYSGYETYELTAAFQLGLLERIRLLPGVIAAGGTSRLPMAASDFPEMPSDIEVFGASTSASSVRQVWFRTVTHGYLDAMRTPIVAGRAWLPADRADGGAPVLISASLAARLFPNESALGKRIRGVARRQRSPDEDYWNTVIGVAADVRADGIANSAPEIVYIPMLNVPDPASGGYGVSAFAVHTTVPPTSIVPAVRSIVRELDPKQPIASVRTMQDIVSASTARTTFITLLLAIAAGAAVLLGAIGIYGVLSYAVGQRRREIALRIALGSRPAKVVRMVLRDAAILVAVGLAVGAVAAALLTRFLRGLLFGVGPTDPITFGLAIVLLLAIAMLACALPARRAAAVEPVEALAEA